VIRVYDDAGNVSETHEHKGDLSNIASTASLADTPFLTFPFPLPLMVVPLTMALGLAAVR